MQKDKNHPGKRVGWWAGMEPWLQIELFHKHIIQVVFMWGWGFIMGGGIGYAYELELAQRSVLLELGAVVGGFNSTVTDEVGVEGERFTCLLLRPTFHFGYRFVYFSLGPRMYVGDTVILGFTAGVMFRI